MWVVCVLGGFRDLGFPVDLGDHITILVQFKVVMLELISKSRHPLFQLVIFLTANADRRP